jgi:hypothetical protein
MQISGRNVNDVFTDAIWYMRTLGDECLEQSRNGPVLVSPEPVVSKYLCPWERVLFDQRRDANPTFHLMEAIWMLAGQCNVAWLSQFNGNIVRYADNGVINGAYGHRWRTHFSDVDQISYVVKTLQKDPTSRRAVINMWDPVQDNNPDWKDVPCNTTIYFDLRGGKLNMTVCCRSNDAIWGCYGANVVHFSVLQEYIAAFLKVPMGVYLQFSNNFHIYTDLQLWKDYRVMPPIFAPRYRTAPSVDQWGNPFVVPLVAEHESPAEFKQDCYRLITGERCKTNFMLRVAEPMRDAYLCRRVGDADGLHEALTRMANCDWYYALTDWIKRRDNAQGE